MVVVRVIVVSRITAEQACDSQYASASDFSACAFSAGSVVWTDCQKSRVFDLVVALDDTAGGKHRSCLGICLYQMAGRRSGLGIEHASGSCGKFGNKLFTATVVRARQKNTGIAGPTSSFYNAAMAAVAKKSVIELSARPTSYICSSAGIQISSSSPMCCENKRSSLVALW